MRCGPYSSIALGDCIVLRYEHVVAILAAVVDDECWSVMTCVILTEADDSMEARVSVLPENLDVGRVLPVRPLVRPCSLCEKCTLEKGKFIPKHVKTIHHHSLVE